MLKHINYCKKNGRSIFRFNRKGFHKPFLFFARAIILKDDLPSLKCLL